MGGVTEVTWEREVVVEGKSSPRPEPRDRPLTPL
jgi:hypothetical protein